MRVQTFSGPEAFFSFPSLTKISFLFFLFFFFFFIMGNKRLLDTYTGSSCTGHGFSFSNPLSTELLLGLIIVAAKMIMDVAHFT